MPGPSRTRLGRRFRKPRRFLRAVRAGLLPPLLLLLLPIFLVTALPLLPFALMGQTVSERRRPCPRCGLRGTLRDVTPPRPPPPGGGEVVRYRPRVSTTRRWRCEVCEAEFEERDGASRSAGSPSRP